MCCQQIILLILPQKLILWIYSPWFRRQSIYEIGYARFPLSHIFLVNISRERRLLKAIPLYLVLFDYLFWVTFFTCRCWRYWTCNFLLFIINLIIRCFLFAQPPTSTCFLFAFTPLNVFSILLTDPLNACGVCSKNTEGKLL